jgi:O-antigen/teichoic acid export membrane protein
MKIPNVMLNQTVHYMIASVVSAAVGLLSAIVFTRLLSPEEYGVYVVGLSTAGIVSAMLFTWVRVSALRFQSEGGSVDVRATVFLAYLISALAAPVALLIATLTTSVSIERNLAAIFFALGLGLFELGQELLKARMQSFAFMSAAIARACIAFLLCLTAALLGGGGLSQLAMVTITYFITASLFAATIWRRPVAGLNISDLRTFSRFGIPITLSGIVFAVHAALDRMLVFHLMGDNAAGHYGASADLVRQIILIPATSIASATIPLAVRAFARGGTRDARPHLEFSFELLLAAVLPAVVGVAFTSSYIAGVVLGSNFRETAAQIMPILAFAWLFQSISQSYVHASFHLAKTPFLTTLQSVGMLLVNLMMMPVLIVRYGLAGAALGLVAAEAFGMGFGWFLTRKAFPLPFNVLHVLRIASATAIMALVLTVLKPLLSVGIASLCILAACGCLTYLAAAMAFDIVGMRKAAIAHVRRNDLWPFARKSEVTGVPAPPIPPGHEPYRASP